MRVCKHGCGVKLFGFSRANHASTNLKKFSSSKLGKFTATGKNFSFNQCHTKSFAFFFAGKLFYKSNRKLFSCVCIA